MDKITLARKLALHIKQAVFPGIGTPESRAVTGVASSGDATFCIDEMAEEAVVRFIEENNISIAYYTEDAGLREFGANPDSLLIIDPIDGSRGAIAGFETCVVSVAVAENAPEPKFRHIQAGCICELMRDRIFTAEKGKGYKIEQNGAEIRPKLRTAESARSAAWTAEIAGRAADTNADVLRELIDGSSIRGGFFIINSTAYSLTRLVNGQLNAVVDIGKRVLDEMPHLRERYLEAGFGQVMGLFPYDIAAARLIAQEAGCIVTDACGRPFDDISITDCSESNILSIVAATNEETHRRFLESIDRGFDRVAKGA